MLQSIYTKRQFLKRKILYKDVEREKKQKENLEREKWVTHYLQQES